MNSSGSSTLSSRLGVADSSIAGFGLVLAGFLGFMGIIMAAVLYPNYSTVRC